MQTLNTLLADNRQCFGHAWHLPEYRQVELYSKRKKLTFAEPPASVEAPPGILGVQVALLLLESFLASRDDELMEGLPSWQRYLALPKVTPTEKRVAEVYRILRIFRITATHRDGHLELHDGLVRASCTFKRCALSLNITPAGLRLLESFVQVYLASFNQPYSEAYVERLLAQYFDDIVAEVRKFSDEDRILYQFRPPPFFNRYFRYDCDNPRWEIDEAACHFEIGPRYANPLRFPIDFFVHFNEVLHIVPVEALQEGSLPLQELPRWAAREPYQYELPPDFRQRFGREVMVIGLPMT